jgi:hypothetical protein
LREVIEDELIEQVPNKGARIALIRAEPSQPVFQDGQWTGRPDACLKANQQDRGQVQRSKVQVTRLSPAHRDTDDDQDEAQHYESDVGGVDEGHQVSLEMIDDHQQASHLLLFGNSSVILDLSGAAGRGESS